MDVQPGSEFKNIVPPHQRATYEAHQLISAAASHFKRAFNIAVKFAIGYRLSGGLRVLAVVIAARVDIQIVESVAERIELMVRILLTTTPSVSASATVPPARILV